MCYSISMAVLLILAFMAAAANTSYETEVTKWRQDREARLKAPDGWLSLVGLVWLNPGRNEAPLNAGWFTLQGDRVTFTTRDGKTRPLRDDRDGDPEMLEVNGVKLSVIRRGERFGIRVRDNNSEYRRNFRGLRWYPVNREWLVHARYLPRQRAMKFDSQTGDKQDYTSPGYIEFERRGQKLRLTPVSEDGQLFFVFRDKTAGKTTYPAARFLYADLPSSGRVTLDFNKAYNPPCVFTPYATCPLPPPENRLPIEVPAGELMYGEMH
jgi:uncharacterized protein